MLIPIDQIYIPPAEGDRIREAVNLAAAVKERSRSLLRLGQLQPILVEKLPEPTEDGKVWKLVDGMTRLASLAGFFYRVTTGDVELQEALEKVGIILDHIEASEKGALDPLQAKMMEYEANESRANLTWNEKGRYVRDMYERLIALNPEWKQKHVAEYLDMSEAVVSQLLALTDPTNKAALSERVQTAKTKGAALKQLKVATEKNIRFERALREQEREIKATVETKKLDHVAAAERSFHHGDAREWIKTVPDNSLDWFHWDPPYGGAEGEGGAFASHTEIQTDTEYALQLMQDMIPEIWRVLKDGCWLAIWYTPVHYDWLRFALQGHEFDADGYCTHCEKFMMKDYIWLHENYSCRPSPHRFWVNPYPNIWFKPNRVADGSEITRFYVKQTEPFLLAGKNVDRLPILMNSGRGNVFSFDTVEKSERRHVNHKPVPLLTEILSGISVPGSLGGDAGLGSGSIIEAAYNSGRKIIGAELSEEHFRDSLAVALPLLKDRNMGPLKVANWFVP